MTDIVIQAENLGKKYTIGHQTERGGYVALRDVLAQNARAFWRTTADLLRGKPIIQGNNLEEVWALKDVSFEIRRGETVGIIGRNGAGKSTLLKVLSRITEPSAGRVTIKGRVASLLEVGTGFHPELTGRENVYLNGAILGMTRAEVKRKFDEIVAFAEIEKFLDTPVKRYSSGMYVRLAFAVAAHLEPEILLVDEVLAVGDAAFQKKCLGKMEDVAGQGRTILFVSHNMAAVQGLCRTAIVLEQGQTAFYGYTKPAIELYLQSCARSRDVPLEDRTDRKGNQMLRFTEVSVCDEEGNPQDIVLSGQNVLIKLGYVACKELNDASVLVAFNVSDQGYILLNINSYDSGHDTLHIYREGYFHCKWKNLNLTSGTYDCTVFCSINNEIVDWVESAFSIRVEDGDFFGSGRIIKRQGKILTPHSWSSHARSLQKEACRTE